MSCVYTVEITHNDEIASGIFKMSLNLPADYPRPEPGQFVNLYLNDESLLLPRPISVCDWADGVLTLVYAVVGVGTKVMSSYGRGARIRISSPLGNGFACDGIKSCVLVGGGVGVPPLLYLAKRLAAEGCVNILVVLGFRSEPFLDIEFPCGVQVATDDGSYGFKGNALELLEKVAIPAGTQLLACGPKPMLGALAKFAAERGIELQVSLEERMGCGYGACVGCVCKTTDGSRKVCEDGPVFSGGEVIWDD